MVERVLAQDVNLIEQEHGMDALGSAALDVAPERVEQTARSGCCRREAEGVAELRQKSRRPSMVLWQYLSRKPAAAMLSRSAPQDTVLADTGLADEYDGGPLLERLEQGSTTTCLEAGSQSRRRSPWRTPPSMTS